MSHPLIASLSVACLVAALPLAAYSAEDTALPAQNPLLSRNMTQDGFRMLRVKTGTAPSAARMTPVIYGPDFIPKWQQRATSHDDAGASKLEGDQFKFR
jgi:hypothetical protein